MQSPLDMLFPFQRAIVSDPSRFKLLNCARQCGKSTVFAFEAAMSCALRAGDSWVALSVSQRQSDAWLERAAPLSRAWCAFLRARYNAPLSCTCKKGYIAFSNGSRIVSLPAMPRTIRGYSANVILDEFAFHEKPEEVWAAVFPTVSNEIGGRRFRLFIGSTPSSRQNLFWRLFCTPTRETGFKRWRVSVHEAVADGVPINIPALKNAIADDIVWQGEYECSPPDDMTTLFPPTLLQRAEDSGATIDCDDCVLDKGAFYVGVDIGRRHDLTAIVICERMNDGKLVVRAIRTLKNRPFKEQSAAISRVVRHKGVRACQIDATGIGAQLGEDLSASYRNCEAVKITHSVKVNMFLSLRRRFDSGDIRLPRTDNSNSVERKEAELFNEDLQAIQRVVSHGGVISFFAPSRADGHSDRACALALAVRAAGDDWVTGGKINISAPTYKEPFGPFGDRNLSNLVWI